MEVFIGKGSENVRLAAQSEQVPIIKYATCKQSDLETRKDNGKGCQHWKELLGSTELGTEMVRGETLRVGVVRGDM